MISLSEKARLLKPSATLAMAARAKELQAAGKDVISLTVGEPDWATSRVAAEAGILAIQSGKTKYTPAHGIPELRAEIAKQTSAQLGVSYNPNEVVVTSGAKYAVYSALAMILNPSDEVLIPSPYWVSYPTMVELAGGVPKIITCDETVAFKLTPGLLQSAVTAKAKALILCSPSNPTGVQYTKEEIKNLAKALGAHPNLTIICDDIYNRLVFGNETLSPHLLQVAPDLRQQMIVVNGASKSYAMTGWRVGWALGPQPVMQVMADFLSQTTSNLCSISQYAALAALQHGEPELAEVRRNLSRRLESVLSWYGKIPGTKLTVPNAGFFLWMDVRGWLGRKHRSGVVLTDSKQAAEIALTEHLVATVPGSEFGCEGYLRLSFAASEAQLEKAAGRLTELAASLGPGR